MSLWGKKDTQKEGGVDRGKKGDREGGENKSRILNLGQCNYLGEVLKK